ncbi:MAG: riboflavin biosynthesis protein RibF [Ruminococcus sp.]|nr:riboflavin biosynthesis protein RibF [Ruminococcus sp.]
MREPRETDLGAAVALGIFDGVHRGHAAVISRAVKYSEEAGLVPSVCTFKTASVDTKGGEYAPIYSDETKCRLIEGLGIKNIRSLPFGEIKEMSGETFVRKFLIDAMKAKALVCGGDFRFGKNASCGCGDLEKLCRQSGMELIIADDVTEEDTRISSADIRRLIRQGEISRANRLLGHDYLISGSVAAGNKLGRTMDFPTANQKLDTNAVMPKFGVYASYGEIDGRTFRGVTNIGVKPTVDSSGVPLAETHFPGFSGDLYGRLLDLRLVCFVRPEMKFGSKDKLREQISADVRSVTDMDINV